MHCLRKYWVLRVERLKRFQVHFGALHRLRLRLNPWACVLFGTVNHSASSLPPWFSFHFVFVNFPGFVVRLICDSRGSVVPR